MYMPEYYEEQEKWLEELEHYYQQVINGTYDYDNDPMTESHFGGKMTEERIRELHKEWLECDDDE